MLEEMCLADTADLVEVADVLGRGGAAEELSAASRPNYGLELVGWRELSVVWLFSGKDHLRVFIKDIESIDRPAHGRYRSFITRVLGANSPVCNIGECERRFGGETELNCVGPETLARAHKPPRITVVELRLRHLFLTT